MAERGGLGSGALPPGPGETRESGSAPGPGLRRRRLLRRGSSSCCGCCCRSCSRCRRRRRRSLLQLLPSPHPFPSLVYAPGPKPRRALAPLHPHGRTRPGSRTGAIATTRVWCGLTVAAKDAGSA
ncbi:uncharacterized protein LOC110223113 [Phascolarctos cinereus]